MKARSVKLKEAHKKPNGVLGSFCSVAWDLEGQHLVTSSSSDTSISIHDRLHPSNPPKTLCHHKDGVTALALSPNSTCLVTGSLDRSVKLYRFPAGEFQANIITRFTLPIRALAFNKPGRMLAAAGDDEEIKLINTIDYSITRVLKGHRGSIVALDFDPDSEYLASIDSVGTVIYWELSSGNPLFNLKGIAPVSGSDLSVLTVLSWSPDGNILAVPGLKNDIVMYNRYTAEKQLTLTGEHKQSICFLSWSPNGKYIASSGLDKQVVIWELDQREAINHQKFDDIISCMAWKPNGNALAVIDVMGKYGVWELVIPSTMKSPSDGAPNKSKSNGLLLIDEYEDEPSICGSEELDDVGDDTLDNEPESVSRKRLHKSHEDSNARVDLHSKYEPRKKASRCCKEGLHDGSQELQTLPIFAGRKMQEAFQSGSTPVQAGKRCFLCYNMIGTITTIENDGYSHIEVNFHDTGFGPRVPSMNEHVGYTIAALNENGSVFASPCKGENNISSLLYRPFNSWASKSEWSMQSAAKEEVKAVALGSGWVAAVTSLNYLRIFTDAGMQRHVVSLDGPVVTTSGYKDELAVVTHAFHHFSSDDQVLELTVFNISNGTQPFRGRLPLTPGSRLSWLGFSEEGQISSYDSKGVLRVFTNEFGGSWIPVFTGGKEESDVSYWVVGLNATKLFCIVCKSPDSYPQVSPKPVLTPLSLSLPLMSSDIGACHLEREFIMNMLHVSQTQKKIEEMVAAGLDIATKEEDRAFSLEKSLDKCILKLMEACCNANKFALATQFVGLLTLESSIRMAIKFVTLQKLPALAERFSAILEERLHNETMEAIAQPSMTLEAVQTRSVEVRQLRTVAKQKASAPETEPASPQMFSPLLKKQEKAEGRTKVGGEKMEPDRTTTERNTKEGSSTAQISRPSSMMTSNREDSRSLCNSKNKSAIENNTMEEGSPVQVLRPVNPFAKAPNNKEKPSLFDSLKKMKNSNGSTHH